MTCRLRLLTFTVSSLAFVTYAHAQESADGSEDAISAGDIIVTAQRRSQTLKDVSATVNVVDNAQLIRQGISNTADLTKVVSGLTVAANGDGTPIYTLRGVSFNSLNFGTSPTVSVNLDEAPIPFSIMTQGATLDVERVEVLKGPQGTLYGQNATGGAINYIANKPTSKLSYGGVVSFGRFNTLEGQAFISGPLTDTLGVRVAVGGTRADGWQRSVTRDDTLGDQRRISGRVILEWQPTNQLKISANINGWRDNSDTQAPQFIAAKPNNPAMADPLIFTIPSTTGNARSADWDPNVSFRKNLDFIQAVGRIDYDLTADLTFTSLSDYTHLTIHTLSENDGSQYFVSNIGANGFVKSFNQEFRFSGNAADEKVHFIVGGNYQKDRSHESDIFTGSPISSSQNTPFGYFTGIVADGKQSNRTWAIFGNMDWDLTSRLTLSVGARKTWVKHYTNGCSRDLGDGSAAAGFVNISNFVRTQLGLPIGPPILPGGCVNIGPDALQYQQIDSFKESNFSWRGSLNYKLTPELSIYGSVNRGFKAGNYQIAAVSSYISFVPVLQEKLTAYELGIKGDLFDRKLSLSLAAYHYDYRDKQLLTLTQDQIFGLQFTLANIPKSKVDGFDADITFRPIKELTIRSTLTYADSRVGTASGFDVLGTPTDLTGHPFNLAPKWISVNDAELRIPLNSDLTGFIGGTATYNSRTFADLADSPLLTIKPYTVLDFRLGAASNTGGWRVMAFVKNATDKYYVKYAVPGGDSVLRYASPPRTFGITFSFKH